RNDHGRPLRMVSITNRVGPKIIGGRVLPSTTRPTGPIPLNRTTRPPTNTCANTALNPPLPPPVMSGPARQPIHGSANIGRGANAEAMWATAFPTDSFTTILVVDTGFGFTVPQWSS